MKPHDEKKFSSRLLLEKIGITSPFADTSLALLGDDPDMEGNLAHLLKERYHHLKEVHHTLKPGMIVTWKPGLKNRRWPARGIPGIVVEMLATPIFDTDEAGSTYFREPLDMVIGVFMDAGEHRGEFYVFHTSSERYQPCAEEEA